jgi:hypothetical protein
MSLLENLKLELPKLVEESQKALGTVKIVAITQAWKILQLTIAIIIQKIEALQPNLAGKDKKEAALQILSQFYDNTFVVVDVPFVPSLIEPLMHKYIKLFLMTLVGSTIDAMVTTFRELGVFNSK